MKTISFITALLLSAGCSSDSKINTVSKESIDETKNVNIVEVPLIDSEDTWEEYKPENAGGE